MSTSLMRYVLLQQDTELQYVEMPADYAYQLSALNLRLHKEISKLTATDVPKLPRAVAECSDLELLQDGAQTIGGLDYINALEQSFARLQEQEYPLISLLTEIRALQAQLEQWYEEYAEQQ
ncbi:hydrolase/acyltransferase [Paenibacillus hunanensis]|uniref:hydrolase/acyltransferase n=1 Tax=Paenibacillus hunanensis TaxID=539262 RepID=UPI0020266FF4|nr:hydrolase/acyltransferase [Paenibacillus hunanensis]MCL9659341.1 hydrolase/acyltransferase [Paenibacillus hunanensis]